MTIGDVGYCSGNVKNGSGIHLCDGFLIDMMNTWMRPRPTSNMKKGWICRKIPMTDRCDRLGKMRTMAPTMMMTQ